jgi:hypothetical protein
MKPVIESFIEYLNTFQPIEDYLNGDGYVGIEWLRNDGANFDIVRNPTMGSGTIKRDVLGNETKQLSVMFRAFFKYSEEIKTAVENHEFFDNFMDWIEANNKAKVFPVLDGYRAVGMYITQTPFLFDVDTDNSKAIYSLILQLQYMKLPKKEGQ